MRTNNPEIIFSNSGLLSALYFAKLVIDTLLDAKHLALKASAELGLAGTIHQSVQCGNPRVAELLTWQLGAPQIMLQGMKRDPASGVTSVVLHGVKQ